MFQAYCVVDGQLYPEDADALAKGGRRVWVDLFDPNEAEIRAIHETYGIDVPTRSDMEEIELSSRLFRRNGASFMTVLALSGLDSERPVRTHVTFILKGDVLFTVRFVDLSFVHIYLGRVAENNTETECAGGERVLFGMMEAMVDRLADSLERIGGEIDKVSHAIFPTGAGASPPLPLQAQLVQIGRKGEYLTLARESLVSLGRAASYHLAMTPAKNGGVSPTLSPSDFNLILRDTDSLESHAAFLSDKITFLLDATMGLINLEQSQIVKIFSVVSVIFMPPTLVASVYGMNFHFMPELSWPFGYPFALFIMVLSAVLPFLYFKKRGWL